MVLSLTGYVWNAAGNGRDTSPVLRYQFRDTSPVSSGIPVQYCDTSSGINKSQ
jgi:hypothetical protein